MRSIRRLAIATIVAGSGRQWHYARPIRREKSLVENLSFVKNTKTKLSNNHCLTVIIAGQIKLNFSLASDNKYVYFVVSLRRAIAGRKRCPIVAGSRAGNLLVFALFWQSEYHRLWCESS